MMSEFKVGEIIKVQVIGSQHYGIFIKCLDDESYTGLIHISEISNDFVKDVNKFAKLGDIIYAKILDVDYESKHVKLSIKATLPKTRYRSSYTKVRNDDKLTSFSSLEEKLNGWISKQLKEKRQND